MSRDSAITKNKYPKVHFQQYLPNYGEPRNSDFHDSPSDLETKEQLRIKNHAAEMQRVDEIQLSALHARVARLKLKFNAERHQQGLQPLV